MSRFDEEYRKGAVASGSHRNEMPMASLGRYLLSDEFNFDEELAASEILQGMMFPKRWLQRVVAAFGGQTHLPPDDPAMPVYLQLEASVGPDRAAVIMLGLAGEWGARLKASAQLAIGAERPEGRVPTLLQLHRQQDRGAILHRHPWPKRWPVKDEES